MHDLESQNNNKNEIMNYKNANTECDPSSLTKAKTIATTNSTNDKVIKKPSDSSFNKRAVLVAALINSIATVAFKWIVAAIVRKLLREAENPIITAATRGSNNNHIDDDNYFNHVHNNEGTVAPRERFWEIVFMDNLSFGQITLLGFVTAFILVISNSFMTSIATIVANKDAQKLRRQILENFLVQANNKGSNNNNNDNNINVPPSTETAADHADASSPINNTDPSTNTTTLSIPNVLIRQVAIIEQFKASHEIWLLVEKLVVACCLIFVFVFTWIGGFVALALLIVAYTSGGVFERLRRPVLEQVESLQAVIHSHVLDVLKNADEVILAKTKGQELFKLRVMEATVNPIALQSAKLKAVGDFSRIGSTIIIPLLFAVIAWRQVANATATDSTNIAFSVIAALLVLDEAHKSLVHLVFIEEKRLEAETARRTIQQHLGSGVILDDDDDDYYNDDDKHIDTTCSDRSSNDKISSNNERFEDFKGHEKNEPSSNVLSVKNLVIHYPGQPKPSVNNISISFQLGKTYAIVGDSGAGKSTLLKAIAGLVPIKSGSIQFNPSSSLLFSSHQDNTEKPKIVYMKQASASTLFRRSIRENIVYGCKDGAVSDDKIWKALKQAEVDSLVKSFPDGLDTILEMGEEGVSGGERQRLQLARLFCTGIDADIVLIDEGVSELDPTRRDRILNHLQVFLQNKTAIFVTHHSSVFRICDDICNISEIINNS